MCKRMKSNFYPIPFRKIDSKCIKDLNVRAKIIKVLEERVDHHGIGFGNGFFYVTSRHKQ